jgi:hypothetical protein
MKLNFWMVELVQPFIIPSLHRRECFEDDIHARI